MPEDLLQRCEVCKKKMVTKRFNQKTCSLKCAGVLGGRVKSPSKGFGGLGSEAASIAGKKSKRKR